MTYYVLAWGMDGGLITTTLSTGGEIVLIHSDNDLANRLGLVILEQTGRGVATIGVDAKRKKLRAKLEAPLGDGVLAGIEFVFPDDPRYVRLMNEVLG